jgi:hypothetical protein
VKGSEHPRGGRLAHPCWRVATLGAAAALALALAACGSGKQFVNAHRPPQPIDLVVYVDNNHVSISPAHFGGGPVKMIVTNEATGNETLNIFKGGKQVATSHSINSDQTADIDADLGSGTYFASAGPKIATARIDVTKSRPNADNALLQP